MTPRAKATKRRKRRRKQPAEAAIPTPAPLRASPLWHQTSLRGVALGLSAVAFLTSFWLFVLYPSTPGPGRGQTVDVVLPRDADARTVATILTQAGLIDTPRLFAFWVRMTGGAHSVVAGKHILTDDASPRELMARLERRATRIHMRVTFPEGWTRFDIARRLQEKDIAPLRDFLDATTDPDLLQDLGIDGDSAEGYLFPATYDLSLDADARDVVRLMKREFDRRWDILSRAHGSTLEDTMTSAKLGIRDVVTLASMVEKETALDEERPMVASVFLNRMRDAKFSPKRLECDPTAAYGCLVAPEKAPSCAGFTGKPTAAIEHDPNNPYSTYTHEGLPPGPIANPGAKALEAVMAPAATRFFYFVARDGHSTFSETYGEHTSAVRSGGRH